jgi:hypothetical protein
VIEPSGCITGGKFLLCLIERDVINLSLGVINMEAWSSRLGVGRWTNNPAL